MIRAGRDWDRLLRLLRSDRLSRSRPAYAYCAALACLQARHCGYSSLVLTEFGVAWGDGLRELARLGRELTRRTGIDVSVVGFDSGIGLPKPHGHRDHPEIWREGQFSNASLKGLQRELVGSATVLVGELSQTVAAFVDGLKADQPLGAVMLDVDLYTSARDALRVFAGPEPASYLPGVLMYVDDVDELLTFNSRCGEALAIAEHNASSSDRFVEAKRIRVGWPSRRWHEKIYACHVLDHPVRMGAAPRRPLEISVDRY
jgi:hypothetical protein